ncbi:iron-sulfur assembly protein 2 [[Candida] anglica]|uniref:Iron-sulfur assembly protein 2 n=1 Tax=[Candida] anglica TaxID=148631 RepID=A0ABP0EM53_9ASCO
MIVRVRNVSLRGRILPRVRTPLLLTRSMNPLLNYYSTSTTTTPKVLKPSSFAQPIENQSTPNVQKTDVPQEDIDDFAITKLIHGQTDLHIAITERASNKLTDIATADNNPKTALKISVESGGCHGFQYNLELTDLDVEMAKAKEEDIEDELLVFKRQQEGKTAVIVLDDSSLQILQDSKVDYTKELIGSQFKVVDSPYTSTACGCGASFDFDFEKLEKKNNELANKS